MHEVVDIGASVASYARQWDHDGDLHPVKLREDLDRYAAIIERTRPDLVVETGTWNGESARWFATQGIDVITVDIAQHATPSDRVTTLVGSSTDPSLFDAIAGRAEGRRTMVSLDSDHSAEHVRKEIDLYHRLVSPGCYLVVEDGICRWLEGSPGLDGSPGPLDAIEDTLTNWPGWQRDEDIEAMHPVTMHVGGWWLREDTADA